MGDQYAVLPYRIEVVRRHFGGCLAVGAVVVVPVLRGHQGRDEQAGDRHGRSYGRGAAPLEGVVHPVVYGRHAESYPYRERIERSGIGIIPFTDLERRLVEVHHDGDACHEEHQEHQPAAALVPVKLEEKAQQAQEQRKEIIVVLALVFLEDEGCIGLVSQPRLVDEADTALPVAIEQVSRHLTVDLVLTTDEIPHEVAPVHPVQLIVEEECEIGAHRGLAVGATGDALALAVHVSLVEIDAALVGSAPHTGEEHLAGSIILRIDGAVDMDVLAVERSPVPGSNQIIRSVEILPVHDGRGTVLLTGEITHQCEGIVRLVFVGRGLGARTDDVDAENGEADNDGRAAQQGGVPEHLLQLHGPEKAPETERKKCHQEECRSGVVREAEDVHEEQVHVCGELGQPWNDEEQDDCKYHH